VVREVAEISVSDGNDGEQQNIVKLIMTRKEAIAGKRIPAVLLLHGTGGHKESDQLKPLSFLLLEKGLEVITFDSRYHGDRAAGTTKEEKRKAYDAALIRSWKHGRETSPRKQEFPFIYDTVWDTRRILDYLTEHRSERIDIKRIGMAGISLGGMHTWFSAMADPRIAVSIPLIGVQTFRWGVDNDQWQERVAVLEPVFKEAQRELGWKEMDATLVRKVWNKINPGLLDVFDAPSSLPLLAPRPLMVLNGEKDGRCPREGVEEGFKAAKDVFKRLRQEDKASLYFAERVGHAVTPKMVEMAANFFQHHLLP